MFTLCSGASKRFMKAFKALRYYERILLKGPQRSVKIKI